MYKILPGQGAAAENIILTRLIPGPFIWTSAVTKIKCLRCGFISDYNYIDIHLGWLPMDVWAFCTCRTRILLNLNG